MSESIRVEKNDETTSFSKEWKKDGFDYSVRVEKVEGGFIISKSKCGYAESDSDKKEYISEHKKSVSTTNPFAEKSEDLDDKLFGFVNEFFLD